MAIPWAREGEQLRQWPHHPLLTRCNRAHLIRPGRDAAVPIPPEASHRASQAQFYSRRTTPPENAIILRAVSRSCPKASPTNSLTTLPGEAARYVDVLLRSAGHAWRNLVARCGTCQQVCPIACEITTCPSKPTTAVKTSVLFHRQLQSILIQTKRCLSGEFCYTCYTCTHAASTGQPHPSHLVSSRPDSAVPHEQNAS